MKMEDVLIEKKSEYSGRIRLSKVYSYEVYGPFGVGYNIRVTRNTAKAELIYRRDGPGAFATTDLYNYEMSRESMFRDHHKILEITEDGTFEPIDDEIALALFIVNHHFSKKTGPFERKSIRSTYSR